MKDQQHNPSMTEKISGAHLDPVSLPAKGAHKPPSPNIMLFSMLTGLRIQEVINLRYRDLPSETDQETGNWKCFRFQVPKTSGGADGT